MPSKLRFVFLQPRLTRSISSHGGRGCIGKCWETPAPKTNNPGENPGPSSPEENNPGDNPGSARPAEPGSSSAGPQEGKGQRTPRPKAKTPLTEYKKYYNRNKPGKRERAAGETSRNLPVPPEVWAEKGKGKGGKTGTGAYPVIGQGKGAKSRSKSADKGKGKISQQARSASVGAKGSGSGSQQEQPKGAKGSSSAAQPEQSKGSPGVSRVRTPPPPPQRKREPSEVGSGRPKSKARPEILGPPEPPTREVDDTSSPTSEATPGKPSQPSRPPPVSQEDEGTEPPSQLVEDQSASPSSDRSPGVNPGNLLPVKEEVPLPRPQPMGSMVSCPPHGHVAQHASEK